MTPEQAYRKGQEDMRRRCEDLWRGWYWGGDLVRAMKPGRHLRRSSVALRIRHKLKIRKLADA